MVSRRAGLLPAALFLALAAPAAAAGELEAEVREAELAFAESARERDLAAFLSFVHPEARFLGGGEEPTVGPDAVAAAWAPFFEPDGPSIDWRPERVTVNEGRGLAISTGPYTIVAPDGTESGGTFFSVWQRDEERGRWRVLFDGGTAPGPLPEPRLSDLFSDEELFVAEEVAEGVVSFAPPANLETIDATSVLVFGEGEVLVVDPPGLPHRAERLVGWIEERTSAPVRWIVQTHWHADHVLGTELLRRRWPDAEVIGHRTLTESLPGRAEAAKADQLDQWRKSVEAARQSLGEIEDAGEKEALERKIGRNEAAIGALSALAPTVPTVLVDERLELAVGERPVVLRHLPGHTDGDLVVILPESGVMAAGDLVDAAPFAGHGDLDQWLRALAEISAESPMIVVPGHGRPQKGLARVEALRSLLESVVRAVEAALAAGDDRDAARAGLTVPEEVRRELVGESEPRARLFDQVVSGLLEKRWSEVAGGPHDGS